MDEVKELLENILETLQRIEVYVKEETTRYLYYDWVEDDENHGF